VTASRAPAAPGADRIAALLRAYQGPLALALSGGGDSMALLALVRALAPERRLHALIVDHRLRPGSDKVAAGAATAAQALGAQAQILTLEWPSGAPSGAQALARRARYRALAEAARARECSLLLVAHTADDQLETAYLREAAASGPYGLAGMAEIAPAPVWPHGRGIRIARPLLGVRRAALRDWLRAQGVAWIEDPANVDPRFARVRARADLTGLSQVQVEASLSRVAAHAAAAADLDRRAAEVLAQTETSLDNRIDLDARALDEAPQALRLRAYAALAAAGSGRAEPLRGDGLKRLALGGWETAALGGALFSRRGGRLAVRRDPGPVLGRAGRPGIAPWPAPLVGDVWDGRLLIAAGAEGSTIEPRRSAVAGVCAIVRTGTEPPVRLAEAVASGLLTAEPLARDLFAHVLWRAHLRVDVAW
jgi:tRNA(Ile)-lysidine synthase